MGIPDHLTCLLRNLSAGQEATVRTGHGTTDWFQRKAMPKNAQTTAQLHPSQSNAQNSPSQASAIREP